MRRLLRRLERFGPYGPRGWVMAVFALAAFGRMADYLRPVRAGSAPILLREIAPFVPVCIWGVLWGLTGLLVLVCAFRKRQGLALGVLAGMSMVWAVLYAITAIWFASEDAIRSWNAAFAFLLFFVVVVAMALMINPARIRDVPDA